MKKFLLSLGVLLPFVMFIGCDNDDKDSSLYNTWILVSYGNESNEVLKEAKGYYYQITFNRNGTYSGRAYGNNFIGEYVCNGDMIKIIDGNIDQGFYEGSDPDRFFIVHLSDVYTYKIIASELRLYYSEDQFFKFRIKEN